MKLFWTSTSAAKELGINHRTVVRHLNWLGIKPDKLERKDGHTSQNRLYVLGREDMEKLRESLK